MFGWDQKERLLREYWTADNLAQELYAMFGENVPNTTGAPVVINQPSQSMVAPIQIQNYTDGSPIFQFQKSDGSPGGSISLINGSWNFTDPNGVTKPIC